MFQRRRNFNKVRFFSLSFFLSFTTPPFSPPHISSSKTGGDYERLEFLGDAIIQQIVSVYIWKKFPDLQPGKLSTLRAKLVCSKTLGALGKRLGLNELATLAPTEDRDCIKLAEDLFEATVGAFYLTFGLQKTRNWIVEIFLQKVDWDMTLKLYTNFKVSERGGVI